MEKNTYILHLNGVRVEVVAFTIEHAISKIFK